ncbi:MAG: nucleotidyltransferase domain-containing protein [Chitinispirillia bacterium]|nr:nucleotidyltransferase domain-containing protein [Chitinispirillia bacterium]MCL2267694.1 nucleotidyltransferase domain-containing protein [Chitinispirillia bacterium]
MNHGLSERSVNTLHGIFRKYESINRVILYGSRAMGNYKKGSDIDITLETGDDFTDRDLLHVHGDLDESDLPYFVDCSILANIKNNDLKDHIARVGKALYERTVA